MMARQRLDQAEKLYASAIEYARRAQNPRYEGIWNGNLGNLYSARFHANGDASHREQAVEYLSRAISLAVQTRDLRHESHWNGTLGQLYWALGQTEPALRHLLRAFGLSTQILYGRMIDTHARLLALLYIHRRSFPDACRVAAEFHEAARKSGNGAILLAAQQFHLDVIATVAQAGASKLAITQGRVFAALADDPLLSARLAVLCLELGRTTTQASFRQFAVDLLTEALAACPEAGQAPLYSARANAHALLGKLAPAIADYAETIRRDPQNVRVAMSRAEVLIWSGSYEQARTSLEDLSSQLRNDGDSIIHAWLMCHALNLQGEDFTPHRRLLESKRLFDGDLDYDFQGIEAHLRLLRPPQVTRKQQENTEKIQDLIAELAKWNRSRDG
jgi:tetratricopeptide (TPR) repeat protein